MVITSLVCCYIHRYGYGFIHFHNGTIMVMITNLANGYGYPNNLFEIALLKSLINYWLGNMC